MSGEIQCRTHCWMDRGAHYEELHGWGSPEHIQAAFIDPGKTCMLWDGHPGPHQWTDDRLIGVTFKSRQVTAS